MNKKQFVEQEEILFDSTGMKVSELVDVLKDYLEKYQNTRVCVVYVDCYGSAAMVKYSRLETDEEYEARINEEQKRKERNKKERLKKEEKERKQYERLKKKYGDNV